MIDLKKRRFDSTVTQELSMYVVKKFNDDGSLSYETKTDSYFLDNDTWNVDKFKEIEQFSQQYKNFRERYSHNAQICFCIKNNLLNLQFKYIFHKKVFNEEWSLSSTFHANSTNFRRLQSFINQQYPALQSLDDLDIEEADREWNFWISQKGYAKERTSHIRDQDKTFSLRSTLSNFLVRLFNEYKKYSDTREEWDKDRWNVKELHNLYGVKYNKSKTIPYLVFSDIKNSIFRKELKNYFKKKLISKYLVAETAIGYLQHLRSFFNFVDIKEPNWRDLSLLSRKHILEFIEQLTKYSKQNSKISNQERYIIQGIIALKQFLMYLEETESRIAPRRSVKVLIFPSDKPKQKKKPYDQIDHIPDFVIEQLFLQLNDLHKDVQPIVWIAFKTGLRISDLLLLKQDCLVKLNGKFYIVTDIEKTFVQGHRIPIDEELANIITSLIRIAEQNSTEDNNPEKFIFIRYKGTRKGLPYTQEWVRSKLNKLAREKNIVDENGNLYHFGAHQFRHTYAMKLLNNGTDILTVQELLAHASPEMTLRYARLLDETKRTAFENAIKQGIFHFDLNGEMREIRPNEDVPEDILELLWQDHKLSAIDNPYGTCHARINGNCPYSQEPPCLTCKLKLIISFFLTRLLIASSTL